MPDRLSPDMQRILHAPLASTHLLNELMDPGGIHAFWFDLSHLATNKVVVALNLPFALLEAHTS